MDVFMSSSDLVQSKDNSRIFKLFGKPNSNSHREFLEIHHLNVSPKLLIFSEVTHSKSLILIAKS